MKKNKLAPIVVFGFVRLESLRKTIDALKNNYLAKESDLILYLDGARNDNDKVKTDAVREYSKTITGFKNISICANDINKGLDPSVIAGVTEVLNQYGKAIVIEDDIVTTKNFLDYMNQALDFYENNPKVMSIGSYGLKIKKPRKYAYDVYAYERLSWGWGIWKDRWDSIDWEITDWEVFCKNKKEIRNFNKGGSDLFRMLKACKKGGNMWDIRMVYSQYKQNKISILPILSKSCNIGFGDGLSTHCHQKYSRYKINIDTTNKREFYFIEDLTINKKIHRRVYWYYSIPMRIYSLIRRKLNI